MDSDQIAVSEIELQPEPIGYLWVNRQTGHARAITIDQVHVNDDRWELEGYLYLGKIVRPKNGEGVK